MGKRDSAPTIGWVLTSQLNKWLAIVFWIVLFLVATFIFGAVRHIEQTCQPFGRDWSINGYSVRLVVSGDDTVCETN